MPEISFNISSRTWKLMSREISKIELTNQLDFFFFLLIGFRNKLDNQIKNRNKVKRIKRLNGMISVKNDKIDLKGHFEEFITE